jgi:transcriptional regulator with XRE-family HTH domain
MAHWTAENDDAFTHKLAFDFIAQIEKRMESLPMSQIELAHKLGVSEGAVSKVLNNPQNLTLKTIAKYSQALGVKAAIVAYDDGDPKNEKGLISSSVFSTCWEHAGKPRDFWCLDAMQPHKQATTFVVYVSNLSLGDRFSTNSWTSTGSLPKASNTSIGLGATGW